MKQPADIFVFPTESFFALAAKATEARAIRKLLRLKHRERGKPIALIAASLAQVKRYFRLTLPEERLAKKYWPGSLTIVLTPKARIAARALGARRIGVRVPAHAAARALARRVGAPITATSANRSGQPPTKSRNKVKRDFPGILIVPGRCGYQRRPSSVVSMNSRRLIVLRRGSIEFHST